MKRNEIEGKIYRVLKVERYRVDQETPGSGNGMKQDLASLPTEETKVKPQNNATMVTKHLEMSVELHEKYTTSGDLSREEYSVARKSFRCR